MYLPQEEHTAAALVALTGTAAVAPRRWRCPL